MKLEKKALIIFSIFYLYIPIILFLFGWTKIWVAIIGCITIGYTTFCMYNDFIKCQDNEVIEIKWQTLISVLLLLLIIGYFAGWGRWVNQAGDWAKHNTIIADLVERSWPVYYENDIEHSMLTYYIAQYLFPAFIGKLFHSYRVAEIANFIWAEIGLVIIYFNLIRVIKIKNSLKQFLSAIMLCFFSVPLWLAQIIQKFVYADYASGGGVNMSWHWLICSNGIMLQYSSNYVLLRWVFFQVLAIWLILILFIEHKNMIQHYMTLMLPGVLFGTLSFAGIIPIAIGYAIVNLIKEYDIKRWIKKIFSKQNLLALLGEGIVLIIYFYGNIFSKKPKEIGFMNMPYGDYKGIYFIFIIVNILLYVGCILWNNKKNEILYLAVISLVIIPLFRMGKWNDFGMRCSIPGLFILMYYIVVFLNTYLTKDFIKKNKLYFLKQTSVIMVCLLLLIGGYYPWLEFKDSIMSENIFTLGKEITFGTMETCANRSLEDKAKNNFDLIYNYYSYDIESNLFYKYIARKKIK